MEKILAIHNYTIRRNFREGEMMFLKQMEELKKLVANLQKQGKTEEQIFWAVSAYLVESKKKINPNGDLDII